MKAVEDMTVDQAQAEVKRLRAHLEEIRIAVDRGGWPSEVWPHIRNHVALALGPTQATDGK